jgi:hypothetical protein
LHQLDAFGQNFRLVSQRNARVHVEHHGAGRDLFADWLASLADRRARAFTLARVGRMEAGAMDY